MVRDQFAAGLIQGIDRLYSRLNQVDVMLAKELLDATYYEYPRPAWNTGDLRSSGAAYIGGQKVASTPFTGPNPVGSYEQNYQDPKFAGVARLDYPGGGEVKELRISQLRKETDSDTAPSSTRGIITIIYKSPIAATMHEWEGGMSDDEAGPHYISHKLLNFGPKFNMVMRRVF